MRIAFLIAIEVGFFALLVGYGEFPGFVVWLVLTIGIFYLNRHFALREVEIVMDAEEKVVSRSLKMERAAMRRLKHARPSSEPKRLQPPAENEEREPASERSPHRFVRCAECDAKNNSTRSECWQCKNPLRSAAAPATRSKHRELPEEEARPKKKGFGGLPVCSRCGAISNKNAVRCEACGRFFPE